jgi:hypothetical protein
LDAQAVQTKSLLPGFQPTQGILSAHDGRVPPEDSPEAFGNMVEWSANFLRVVDKLPYVAISYGLIDFFILRPNLDWYKEDVEEMPGRVMADTVRATAVRMGVFAVLAGLTVGVLDIYPY